MDPSNSSERSRSMGRNSRLFFCSAAICSTQKCSQLMLVLFILPRTGYFHTGIGKLNVSGDYPAELPVRRQMSNTVKLDIKNSSQTACSPVGSLCDVPLSSRGNKECNCVENSQQARGCYVPSSTS